MLEYVYLMRAGDIHKIGRSKDPGYRRRELDKYQRGRYSDQPLVIVHLIASKDALALERRLKLAFRPWRIAHEFEWFRLPPSAADWICRQQEPVEEIPDFTPARMPAPVRAPDPLMSLRAAALQLGVETRTVQRWIEAGSMAYFVLGSGSLRVLQSEVQRIAALIDSKKKLG